VSFDSTNQVVSVKPCLKEVVEGRDTFRVIEMAQIDNVPVCWPRMGKWFLQAPLDADDYVLLVCSDRAMDIWQERGGTIDPRDLRRHNITDAIAIPGVFPAPNLNDESGIDSHLVLGEIGGSTIHVKDNGEIHLGSESATDFVSLSTETKSNDDTLLGLIQDLASAINGWSPVAQDGGAALKIALASWIAQATAATVDDVAASKVKAD
jgi:hypothetical protein